MIQRRNDAFDYGGNSGEGKLYMKSRHILEVC